MQAILSEVISDQEKFAPLSTKLIEYEKKITDLESEISLLSSKDENFETTKGRHPDLSIILPTDGRNGFDRYYLDTNSILCHMQAQRNNPEYKYSFLKANCANDVRNCILKGMTDKLREAIKNLNELTEDKGGFSKKEEHLRVTENFFNEDKIFDMPARLEIWLRKLVFYINKLNENYRNQMSAKSEIILDDNLSVGNPVVKFDEEDRLSENTCAIYSDDEEDRLSENTCAIYSGEEDGHKINDDKSSKENKAFRT